MEWYRYKYKSSMLHVIEPTGVVYCALLRDAVERRTSVFHAIKQIDLLSVRILSLSFLSGKQCGLSLF